MSDPAEKLQAKEQCKVEGFPSSHIKAYEESAEIFKIELWNLCVDHLGDDFPIDWLIGILSDTALNLQLLDHE